MNQANDSSKVASGRARHRSRVPARPPVRRSRKISRWHFVRRAFQLFMAGMRLLVFRIVDRSIGGDDLGRELLRARRLRTELEGMGGVFVKIGQLLSVRTDLFPWEVCREFANLLDQVVPFPGEIAAQILHDELRSPPSVVFSRFETQPIAAASIGQVHVAWLRETGAKVAIKIQRPGIDEESAIDLMLMSGFARMADTFNLRDNQRIAPMIAELRRIMNEELSYINEARATDDFRRSLKGRKHVYAPRVYFEHTTDRVLVMEFVEGLPASVLIKAIENDDQEALARFERLGIKRKKLARRFYKAVLEQVNEHDISHSDPHPGNLIIMPGNKICFIDFGAVGYFGPTFRARMERVTAAFANLDVDGAVDATLASWEPLPPGDIDRFKTELKPIYQRMITNAASKHGDPRLKSNGQLFIESARLAAVCGITAPWEHLRFSRLLWEFDTTVIALDPGFNFSKSTKRYYKDRARRALKRNLGRDSIKRFGAEVVNLLATIPQDLQEMRYQAFNLIRRSDNLFVHSMSKMSQLGKQLLDSTLAAGLAAAGVLAYYRAVHGAEATDRWLAEHVLALPWWAFMLLLGYVLLIVQRLRLRVTDIDRSR
jgi:ubiquinone biosynthesis protein